MALLQLNKKLQKAKSKVILPPLTMERRKRPVVNAMYLSTANNTSHYNNTKSTSENINDSILCA